MKPTSGQKNGKGAPGTRAALRALRRAAQKVHTENRKLSLPVIVWQGGKVVEKPARISRTCGNMRRCSACCRKPEEVNREIRESISR
jgi:hypothetical protein